MRPLGHNGDGPSTDPSPSAVTECFLVSESNLDAECKEGPEAQSPRFSRRWLLQERQARKISRSTPRTADTSPAPTIPSPVSMRSLALGEESLDDLPSKLRLESAGVSDATISSVSSGRHSITASSYGDNDLAVSMGSLGPPTHTTIQENPLDSLNSQLIMPSVAVSPPPAFTDLGKAIGKLKVMVTGRPGTGKTSLIRSMIQSCKHLAKLGSNASSQCGCEIFASTRPHSYWQSISGAMSVVNQRSLPSAPAICREERILDRNICFVDLPTKPSAQCQHSSSAVEYIRGQAAVLTQKRLDDDDLWSLLSNGAYPVVDVCLYILPHTGPWNDDIDVIRQIQLLTNVIPVIARAEEVSICAIQSAKTEIAEQLQLADIKIVPFTDNEDSPDVFAVSCAPDSGLETMEASELMDSAYEPPLIKSDLQELVEKVLSPDGSTWLRSAVALRLLWWRRRRSENHTALQWSSYQLHPGWRTYPFNWVKIDAGLDSAKWWQHLELDDWAQCLRRSIVTEQSSFTTVSGKQLEVMQRQDCRSRKGRRFNDAYACSKVFATKIQDPLGLLSVASRLRQERRRTVELISGLGVVILATACLVDT